MRLDYPATGRNREAILSVLQARVRPGAGVLEVASGSGQHACFLAPRLRVAWWQPTDVDPQARRSVDAWNEEHPSVRPALELDVLGDWPPLRPDLVMCVNMVHISPWACTLALLDGASRCLPEGGLLYLYGPYRRDEVPTAPSNEAFDQSLRARDPAWGLRRLEDVRDEAAARGLRFDGLVEMPANNLSVWFVREGGA